MRARVCFVTIEYHPDIGGVGKSARRIARFLNDAYDVDLIAPTPTLAPGQVVSTREDGLNVHRVGNYADEMETMAQIRRVADQLDRQRPFDVFHGFFLPCAKPCLEISRGRPVIASIRGTDAVTTRTKPEWAAAIEHIVSEAARVTTVASDLLLHFERGRARPETCSLVSNSIDLSRHAVSWSAGANSGVVGTLANLREKKNLPLLLEGYARTPAGLRSELLVVGGFDRDLALKTHLEHLAADLHIDRQFTLFGPVPPRDAPAMFGRMYVYALTSDHDGMPNALLEAAAAGVPVVATAVGAIPDIMTNGLEGIIVPPRDPEALAEALTRVLSDAALATRLSIGARRLAERFDYSAERAQWLNLYRQVLDARADLRHAALSANSRF